jgi:RimJ/RimL family protein N-acetyltransferase
MIEYEGKVVGSVWADLEDSEDVPGPSVHIMIGDPDMRGKGVGTSTVNTVLDYLEEQGHDIIYSRHLITNHRADELLKSLGFTNLGEPYISDTLEFQNLIRKSDN